MPALETVLGGNSGPAIASAQAGQVVTVNTRISLVGADMEDAATFIRLFKLPAQHRIVSLQIVAEDLDMGATGALTIGVEDTVQDPSDTSDLVLFAAAEDVQAALNIRYENAAIWDYAAANYDRFIALAIETVSATGLAGDIHAMLVTRPHLGDQFEGV